MSKGDEARIESPTARLASQPHEVSVAEFRESRDKARHRTKPVVDRLCDRHQQRLGLGLLPLSHPLL
ncbi:MAG TPA: hypothetical protein VNP96_01315 [Solirubrobacterales bacterium]|nr:hypothetical protein [Solirubrobacterales bacterium]